MILYSETRQFCKGNLGGSVGGNRVVPWIIEITGGNRTCVIST